MTIDRASSRSASDSGLPLRAGRGAGGAGGDGIAAGEFRAAEGVEDGGFGRGGGNGAGGAQARVFRAGVGFDVRQRRAQGFAGGEDGLLRGGQGGGLETAVLELAAEREEGGGADEGEEQGVHQKQREPFAQPDAQARDGLDEKQLEGLVVGFLRNGGAAGPEGRQRQQERGDAQRVGEMQADQAFRSAVAADAERQQEGGGEQERGQDEDDARAENVAESQ